VGLNDSAAGGSRSFHLTGLLGPSRDAYQLIWPLCGAGSPETLWRWSGGAAWVPTRTSGAAPSHRGRLPSITRPPC